MPYTTREAIATLSTYLGINLGVSVRSIDQTSNRGYEIRLPSGERCVIFVYPISHKQDDSKNFFDTRDSGARERGIAWNYAQTRNLKYFCLAVHDQVEKYKDYIFSLECDEHRIAEVSGTLNGSRNGRGTQVVIPTSCVPSKWFERIYTDNGFYIAVIHKDHIYEYLEQYDNRPYMDKTLPLVDTTEVENDNSVDPPTQSPFTPVQIIYYGVPGCGKSHQIQEDLKKKNITEDYHQVKRVVFHPDYCNADFVGQILPVTKRDGGIRYQFKAGPFTKILRDAYANPGKEYALIIEEINRGNAAAIFGDLFQLLDRKRESDPVEVVNGNSYGPGWSDYCVENDYINAYFRGAYEGDETPNPLPPKTLGKITFNDNVDIRLPPNLSLYATMNTSDQNVFTLDNAFQRRWEMKQISNDLKNDDAHSDEKTQYDQLVGNTGVKWGAFREKINEIIMQSAEENGLSSMEDKRLGGWFIIPKKAPDAPDGAEATITSEAFAEKVLKYLWDDAFKFDRKSHFGNVKTLEELIEKFKTEGFKVFSDEQISGLSQNGSASTQTGTSES